MIRYSQDLVLSRGYTLWIHFFIYIVGILHIERCFIDQHHLLTVYSLSYIQYLCSRKHFLNVFSVCLLCTRPEKTLFANRTLASLCDVITPSVGLLNVNLCLWRQFCRSPYLFLHIFLWHWELYESRGLMKSIKRAHFEECTEYGKVTVSICLKSTTEMFQ